MKNHQYKEHTWLEGLLLLFVVMALTAAAVLIFGTINAPQALAQKTCQQVRVVLSDGTIAYRWVCWEQRDTNRRVPQDTPPGRQRPPRRYGMHSTIGDELASAPGGSRRPNLSKRWSDHPTPCYQPWCVPSHRFAPLRPHSAQPSKVGLASPLMYCGRWVTVSQSYACGDNVCVRRVRKCAGGAYGQGRQQYGEYKFRR